MLFKVILYYLLGYVRISIEGYYIERFINICRNNKILIWNLKRDKNVKLELNVGINDVKKIAKIAKQTKCKMKINKKKGIPFIFNKYRKRKLFFAFLLLIIIMMGITSNFVWNIQIVKQDESDLDLNSIYKDIEEAGLSIGTPKNKINTKEIINNIRTKRNDISWIGIELKGTNAIVKVVKSTEKPDIINEEEYCNVVANKPGIITKINAQNGSIAVKVGDTVNVGTTLINGWMEGKYTGIRYVHARGEVEAKVWY